MKKSASPHRLSLNPNLKRSVVSDNGSNGVDDETLKEKELEGLKFLFKKLKLLTQVDDIEEIKEFFFNSDEFLNLLYEDM